jgi:hypothetical protein
VNLAIAVLIVRLLGRVQGAVRSASIEPAAKALVMDRGDRTGTANTGDTCDTGSSFAFSAKHHVNVSYNKRANHPQNLPLYHLLPRAR